MREVTQTRALPPSRGRRPDIALASARVLACAQAAAALQSEEGRVVSTSRVVSAVCGLFEERTRHAGEPLGDLDIVTVDAVLHVTGLAPHTVDILTAAFQSAAAPVGGIDGFVAAATVDGIDAERLVWAVIAVEALTHLPLVWHQANKLTNSFPGYSADDLVGWGWQGLRVSLRSYDPSRFAFSTYACTRICGSIRDGVRSENPVPKRLTTELRKVSKAEEALTQDLQRVPTLSEVAAVMELDTDRAALLARCAPAASLEEMSWSDDGESYEPSVLRDNADPADAVLSHLLSADIETALSQLDPDDAAAVRLLILDDRPVPEVRQETGATARQLRQRRQRAMTQLADLLAHWAPTA